MIIEIPANHRPDFDSADILGILIEYVVATVETTDHANESTLPRVNCLVLSRKNPRSSLVLPSAYTGSRTQNRSVRVRSLRIETFTNKWHHESPSTEMLTTRAPYSIVDTTCTGTNTLDHTLSFASNQTLSQRQYITQPSDNDRLCTQMYIKQPPLSIPFIFISNHSKPKYLDKHISTSKPINQPIFKNNLLPTTKCQAQDHLQIPRHPPTSLHRSLR